MTTDDKPIFPTVHLAVDIYPHFEREISPGRRETFARDVDQFASALRPFGIPTIRIASGKNQVLYAAQEDWKPHAYYEAPTRIHDRALSHYTFEDRYKLSQALRAAPDEVIFVKNYAGAFSNYRDENNLLGINLLASYLKPLGTRTVIVTGLHTGECIQQTLEGARVHKLFSHVMTNLLADYRALPDQAVDPKWHEQRLRGRLMSDKNVSFFNSDDYIGTLRKETPAPTRPAPASRAAALVT